MISDKTFARNIAISTEKYFQQAINDLQENTSSIFGTKMLAFLK